MTMKVPGTHSVLYASVCSVLAISAAVFAMVPRSDAAGTAPRDEKKSLLKPPENANPYQLPKDVSPVSYDLTFAPDLENFTFDGTETITVKVDESVKSITLNALDLKIKSASIKRSQRPGEEAGGKLADGNGSEMEGTVSLDSEHEVATIVFPGTLIKGDYILQLSFTGDLNDNLRGFYRSHYKDNAGVKHWLATTQMEPTDSRRMFPCFDEPEMKATFKITAIIPDNMVAISNGAVEREERDEAKQKKKVVFEASPRMSSYLVALIVGDFKSTSTKESCGIPVRVWAPSGKEELGYYALDTACKVLAFQTRYFGIPYPAKKLDLIAIPDFRSGAMENLGAITFREASLLVDDKTGSNFLKRRVSNIVAHEIAHQWFGDLVTMKWWDDIWLNEAFASWMATKTVDEIHPDWRVITKSVLTRNESMNVDQLKATRAIHAHVDNPKQAAEMFDPITYDKGESVLRMLEGFVGDKTFQAGINDYLNAHKFGNASSEDLWEAIGKKSSGVPVPEIMKTWVFQSGFPMVTVSKADSDKTAPGTFSLSQQRFFGMPGEKPDESIWLVPLVLRDVNGSQDSNKTTTTVLSKKQDSVSMLARKASAQLQQPGLMLVNSGGMGFYRTHYSPADTALIVKKFDYLTPEERLAFIADTCAQVWNGSLPVEDRLNLTGQIVSEKDPLVLTNLVGESHKIYDFLDEKHRNEYATKLRTSLLPVKERIGWTERQGEQDTVKDLREATLTLLGYAQDNLTISEARDLYTKFMSNHQSVPADITGTVLSIVAYNGGAKEYEEITNAWKKEHIPELEKRFLFKLAVFRQPELIDRTLALAVSSDVRGQDGFRLLADLLTHDASKHRALEFVKSHWPQISEKFPPRSLNAIASACSSFDQPADERSINEFFTADKLPYGKSALTRMLEELHAAVLYRQRNEAKVIAWIK